MKSCKSLWTGCTRGWTIRRTLVKAGTEPQQRYEQYNGSADKLLELVKEQHEERDLVLSKLLQVMQDQVAQIRKLLLQMQQQQEQLWQLEDGGAAEASPEKLSVLDQQLHAVEEGMLQVVSKAAEAHATAKALNAQPKADMEPFDIKLGTSEGHLGGGIETTEGGVSILAPVSALESASQVYAERQEQLAASLEAVSRQPLQPGWVSPKTLARRGHLEDIENDLSADEAGACWGMLDSSKADGEGSDDASSFSDAGTNVSDGSYASDGSCGTEDSYTLDAPYEEIELQLEDDSYASDAENSAVDEEGQSDDDRDPSDGSYSADGAAHDDEYGSNAGDYDNDYNAEDFASGEEDSHSEDDEAGAEGAAASDDTLLSSEAKTPLGEAPASDLFEDSMGGSLATKAATAGDMEADGDSMGETEEADCQVEIEFVDGIAEGGRGGKQGPMMGW